MTQKLKGNPVDLYSKIICSVRTTAGGIPAFLKGGNGAIAIRVVPHSSDANQWLSGQSDSNHDVLSDGNIAFSLPILPFRSTVLETTSGPVDCAVYAMMKISHGIAAHENGSIVMHSGSEFNGCDEYRPENGFAADRGAVCIRIGRKTNGPTSNTEDFLDVWISVSGASGLEDEQCAISGMNAAETWFHNQPDYYVVMVRHTNACSK